MTDAAPNRPQVGWIPIRSGDAFALRQFLKISNTSINEAQRQIVLSLLYRIEGVEDQYQTPKAPPADAWGVAF